MNIENTAAQTEQEQTAPAQTEETAEIKAKHEASPDASEPKPAEPKPAESEAKPEAPEAKPADVEEKSADTEAAPESAFAKIFKSLGMPDGVSDEDGVRSMADELATLRGAFEAMSQGAIAETASELAAIARTKAAADGKDIKAVISELKTQAAYSGFFKPAPSGTGTSVSGKSHSGSADGSMGARLAKASAPKANTSPYFKH